MGDKQLQFHAWVKDSDQSDTGSMGIRIRCIRSYHDHTLTITEKELKTYGVPDFQYTSKENQETVNDLASNNRNATPDTANPPKEPNDSK